MIRSFIALFAVTTLAAACSSDMTEMPAGVTPAPTAPANPSVSTGVTGAKPAMPMTAAPTTMGPAVATPPAMTGGAMPPPQSAGNADMGVGGAAAPVAGGATGADVPVPTCSDKTGLMPGSTTEMMEHDGQQRMYLLHVPTKYDATKGTPLVIDIHGLNDNATNFQRETGWMEKGEAEGFIVVHPNGLGTSWNGGTLCCGSSMSSGVDDEGFIREIVKTIAMKGCIDPARVYVTGLSNGGAMSHLLACKAADVFAASAPVSMANGTVPCEPSRPISMIMFRGTQDNTVPYGGGGVSYGGPFPSAQDDLDQWKMLDMCTGDAMDTHDGLCKTYSGEQCKDGVEVTMCSPAAGHVLYSAAAQQMIPVPDVVWEAFTHQTCPSCKTGI
jgi:polyhydroxybutyrate depolymerase